MSTGSVSYATSSSGLRVKSNNAFAKGVVKSNVNGYLEITQINSSDILSDAIQQINITDNNSSLDSTFYPTFVSNSGTGQTMFVDSVTGPLSYIPFTSTMALTNLSASGTVTGATLTGSNIYSSGSVNAVGTVSGATLTGSNIYSSGSIGAVGTVSGATLYASGTVSGTTFSSTGGIVSTGVIRGATLTGSNVYSSGSIGAVGTVSGATLYASGTVSGTTFSSTGGIVSTGVIRGATLTGSNVYSSGSINAVGTVSGATLTGSNVYSSGSISAVGSISGATLTGSNIYSSGNVDALGTVSGATLNASGTVSGTTFNASGGIVSTGTISGATFVGNGSSLTGLNNMTVYDTNNSTTFFPVFVGSTGAGQTMYADAVTGPLSYLPSTSTLSLTNLTASGTITGIGSGLTRIQSIDVGNGSSSSAFYPTFVGPTPNGNNKPVYTNSIFSFIPSTTVPTLGIGGSGTGVTGTINLATSATGIINLGGVSGGYIRNTSGNITIDPTDLLTVAGNLTTTGTITGATFIGNGSGLTGINNMTIVDTNTSGTFFPVFVGSTGSGQTMYTDSTTGPLSYNPSTCALTLGSTSSSLTVGTTMGTINVGTGSTGIINVGGSQGGYITNPSGNINIQSGSGKDVVLKTNNGSNTALTLNNSNAIFNGSITGVNGIVNGAAEIRTDGNIRLTNTSAFITNTGASFGNNLSVGTIADSGGLYLNGQGVNGLLLVGTQVQLGVTFNANNKDICNVGTIRGATFIGNGSGLTGINNMTIADTNASGTFFPVFVGSTGAGQTMYADTIAGPLSYNPSTCALTLGSTSASLTIGTTMGTINVGTGATGIINLGGTAGGHITNPSGNITIDPTDLLTVAGNLTANGNINSSGNGTFSGNVNVLGDVNIESATQVAGTISSRIGQSGSEMSLVNNSTSGRIKLYVYDSLTSQIAPLTVSSTLLTADVPLTMNSQNITSVGTISGVTFSSTGGIVSTGVISGATLTGSNIYSSGSINALGTVSGVTFSSTGGIVSTGTISGATLTGSNIYSSGSINALGTVSGVTLNATGGIVTASGTISGATLTGSNIYSSGNVDALGTVSGVTLNATGGIFSTGVISGATLTGSNIYSSGNVDALGTVSGVTLNATGGIVTASGTISGATLTGSNIYSSGNVDALGTVSGVTLNATGGIVSAGTISGATFIGNGSSLAGINNMNIVDTNAFGSFFPVFVGSTGAGQTMYTDSTTGPLSYNPSTCALTLGSSTASLTVGTTTGAIDVGTGSGGIINLGGSNGGYISNFSGNITIDPTNLLTVSGNLSVLGNLTTTANLTTTGTITGATFVGNGSGLTGVNKISVADTTSSSWLYPVFVDSAGNDKSLVVDSTSGPIQYNPSTNAFNFNGATASITVGNTNSQGIINIGGSVGGNITNQYGDINIFPTSTLTVNGLLHVTQNLTVAGSLFVDVNTDKLIFNANTNTQSILITSPYSNIYFIYTEYANKTVVLPSPVGLTGLVVKFRKASNNNTTVTFKVVSDQALIVPNASVVAGTSYNLGGGQFSVEFLSSGTNWYVTFIL